MFWTCNGHRARSDAGSSPRASQGTGVVRHGPFAARGVVVVRSSCSRSSVCLGTVQAELERNLILVLVVRSLLLAHTSLLERRSRILNID